MLDDRYGRKATLLTSHFPVDHWHEIVGDPTFGDAILDRMVHNRSKAEVGACTHAHRIALKGGSMRRLYDSTKEGEPPRRPPPTDRSSSAAPPTLGLRAFGRPESPGTGGRNAWEGACAPPRSHRCTRSAPMIQPWLSAGR